MCRILIFGGTTEGRMLAEYCVEQKIDADISVATAYGAELLPEKTGKLIGRLDLNEMINLIQKNKYSKVIDATHPYAEEVTKNIKQACEMTKTLCFRLIRDTEKSEYDYKVATIEEAVSVINQSEKTILSTLGSKELAALQEIRDYHKRVWIRVLPSAEIKEYCTKLGYDENKLILEKGPFSEEQNINHIKKTNAEIMLTKESGNIGGFSAKVSAAEMCGIEVITISRPSESGYSFNEIVRMLGGEL